MARTDDAPFSDREFSGREFSGRDALRAEEGALAAFFDAARAEAPPPLSPAFFAATLADARALAPRPPAPAPRRSAPRAGLGRRVASVGGWLAPVRGWLAPVGGWAGATALAASAAIGFWAGVAGLGADYATPTLWPDVATMESAAAGIGDFFDLASLEG